MSWLSELFGGGDDGPTFRGVGDPGTNVIPPPTAPVGPDIGAKRQHAAEAAKSSAYEYLAGLGLNPNDYDADLNNKLNEAFSYTADDDPNIGQYINNLGEQVYGQRQDATRNKATRDINTTFAPDFETSRIGDTADDAILSGIQGEQRSKADDYVNNLVKRGVITSSGQAAANKNLDDQGARVRTILDELGRSSLESGRSRLTDIANRGRQAASNLTPGNTFDPNSYVGQANQAFDEFTAGLGDSIRSKVPGDLYDTSSLASIAGSAQGAGNLKFDPSALAGVIKPEGEDVVPTKKKTVAF